MIAISTPMSIRSRFAEGHSVPKYSLLSNSALPLKFSISLFYRISLGDPAPTSLENALEWAGPNAWSTCPPHFSWQNTTELRSKRWAECDVWTCRETEIGGLADNRDKLKVSQ
jgi:hypothetical protein